MQRPDLDRIANSVPPTRPIVRSLVRSDWLSDSIVRTTARVPTGMVESLQRTRNSAEALTKF